MTRLAIQLLFILFLLIQTTGQALSYDCYTPGCFTTVHVLTVDPKNYEMIPAKAPHKETVLSIARSHDALAAVNGGFFGSDGQPAGILKVSGAWHGFPTKPRGAIGWTDGGSYVIFDQVLTSDDARTKVIPQSSPAYTSPDEWDEVEHIVGGTPILIRNGALIENYDSEQTRISFLLKRYPRTAVGLLDNDHWVFVVADARFLGLLGGLTMRELAIFMHDLGCVEALNLDGGGPSTLVIDDTIINTPSGDLLEEGNFVRQVSDAILVFPRLIDHKIENP